MTDYRQFPDEQGHFGPFGGRYVGETLMPALLELDRARRDAMADPAFLADYRRVLHDYVGRPTPLDFAERLTAECGGARLWLKREDLAHTGAHKINNTVGQALLARRMGKKRLMAETGAGQHGVATATVAARFGMSCAIYMGAEDVKRQAPNVHRMRLLGAEVVSVTAGNATLKDAMNEAMRAWAEHVEDTFYVIGSVAGPHPYPVMVRDFQRIIGEETRRQALETFGRLPNLLVACVGGGSNAMGFFYEFLNDPAVELLGVEAAGHGLQTGRHAATLCRGRIGVLHGAKSYLLQNADGQVEEAYSISAGLDYPGVGPEHSWLKTSERAEYVAVDDRQALEGFQALTRTEGIIPALEPSHAIYYAIQLARKLGPGKDILVGLSGRGDKDMHTVAAALGVTL